MAFKDINPFIEYILDDNDRLRDLFDFYDADGNGMIQRQELIDVLSLCAHEIGLEVDAEQITDAVFSNAHLNQAGSITFEGLKEVLEKRSNLTIELSLAKALGGQQQQQQRQQQHQRPRQHCQEACRGIGWYLADRWDRCACALGARVPIFNKLRWEYISNNMVRFNFFLGILIISLILIVGRVIGYRDSCGFLILARSSGQCLNFFSSIVVLLVCRRSISLLRARGFGRYLPLDDHVYFHKMIGLFIVFHSLLHTLGHLFNFLLVSQDPKLNTQNFTYAQYLFGTAPGIGWIGGCASLTGWLLLIIIAIMSLAQPFSRSLGKFELFYYTHLLYIPFWALLFIHAPHFWLWFLGPFIVFILETLIRLHNLLTSLTAGGETQIIKAVALPSEVLHLVIKRPPNFEYNPGDWVYVLIPQIAKYEWHPFTISSAPEQEGVIWLHIRAVGEWTRSLRSYFEGLEQRNHLSRFIKSGQFSVSMEQFSSDLSVCDSAQALGASKKLGRLNQFKSKLGGLAPIPENNPVEAIQMVGNQTTTTTTSSMSQSSQDSQDVSTTSQRVAKTIPNINIFIDGPYGSPSSQIFRAEHAVLIATGIGVTPFASILQSIVLHYEKRRQKCPSCAHEFSDTRPPFVCKLRKVDFVWINRDQKSFEWFIKLLAELELTQSHLPPSERFLDIHIHLTAMEPAQTKSIGLQLALYLVHEKNKKDLVTGLRTRTKAGRPNWDDLFNQIQDQKRGKVSVFFCGRPQLGRLLHRKCDSYGFKFRKEIF